MVVSIFEACALLQSGQPVALPTETVYGLAAPVQHLAAIEKVFALKGRPKNNPLIVHLASKEGLHEYVTCTSSILNELTDAFWPGPLTLVLQANDKVPNVVRCDLPTVAFRVPDHPLTQQIIERVGPLVMPSANLSGRPSATQAEHVLKDFGSAVPVVDGGACSKGLESTILMENEGEWVILREGAISAESIAFVLGCLPRFVSGKGTDRPLCPGQLYRHYAPNAKLILNEQRLAGGNVLGFAGREYGGESVYILGGVDSPEEVAKNLYACLRRLDDDGVSEVWVDMDFPAGGLWTAIRNRLEKAAGVE